MPKLCHLGHTLGILSTQTVDNQLAERGGFEPPIRLLTVYRFSKPAPSATRPSLHRLKTALILGGGQRRIFCRIVTGRQAHLHKLPHECSVSAWYTSSYAGSPGRGKIESAHIPPSQIPDGWIIRRPRCALRIGFPLTPNLAIYMPNGTCLGRFPDLLFAVGSRRLTLKRQFPGVGHKTRSDR